jgi:hypothetical protein
MDFFFLYMKYLLIFCLFIYHFSQSVYAQVDSPVIVWEKIFGSDSIDAIDVSGNTLDGSILFSYKRYFYVFNSVYERIDENPLYLSLVTSNGDIKWTKKIIVDSTFLRPWGSFILDSNSFYFSGYFNGASGLGTSIPVYKVGIDGTIDYIRNINGYSGVEWSGRILEVVNDTIAVELTSSSNNGDFPYNLGGSDSWVMRISPDKEIISTTNLGNNDDDWLNARALVHKNSHYVFSVVREIEPFQSCSFSCPKELTIKKTDRSGFLVDSAILEPYYFEAGGLGDLLADNENIFLIKSIEINDQADYKIYKMNNDLSLVETALFGGSGNDIVLGSFIHQNQIIIYGESDSPDGDVNNKSDCMRNWVIALDKDLNIIWNTLVGEPCKTQISMLIPQPDGRGFTGMGSWIKSQKILEDMTDFWMFKLDYPATQESDACDFLNILPNLITESTISVEKGGLFGLREPYQVINSLGQVIQEGFLANRSKEIVSLPEDLPAGMYWLRVTCEAGATTESFMKVDR